jgi:serine/threonine-protein kinase RsbW
LTKVTVLFKNTFPFQPISSSRNLKKPIKQFHLKVETELNSLTLVLQWFELNISPLLPEQFEWQCKIALVEGFTNTVLHAHKDLPPTTTIDLEVNIFQQYLEIKIWNWGKPFNLQAKLKALVQQKENLLEKEKGWGLQFMERLTDELQYIRTSDRRNCLVMRKNFMV